MQEKDSNTTLVKVKLDSEGNIMPREMIQIQHLLKLNCLIVVVLGGVCLYSNTTLVKAKLPTAKFAQAETTRFKYNTC